MIRQSVTATILAAAVAAVTGIATPAAAVSVEAVKNASTPADHEALAAEYDKEAADARQQAAKHKHMAESYAAGVKYGKVVGSGKGSMKLHCERLAEHFEAVAQDAEALAGLHRQLATQK